MDTDMNTLNSISIDFKNTCRTCLTTNENHLEPIYDYNNVFSPANIVNEFVLGKLNISKNDGLPQQICIDCVNKITKAHAFWHKCVESQQILQEQYVKLSLPPSLLEAKDEEKLTESISLEKVNSTTTFKLLPVKPIIKLNTSALLPISRSTGALSNIEPITNQIEIVDKINDDIIAIDNNSSDYEVKCNNLSVNDASNTNCIDTLNNDNFVISYNYGNIHNFDNDNVIENDFSISQDDNIENTFHISDNDDDNNNYDVDNERTLVFQCKACNNFFKTEKTLMEHILSIHKKEITFKSNFPNKNISCKLCGCYFENLMLLEKHEYEQNCQQRATTDLSHINKETNKISQKIPAKKPNPTKCEICGKMYNCMDNLRRHMALHNGEIHKCKDCGKEFATRMYLNKHFAHVHEIHNKICAYCGLVFTNLYKYEYHVKMHDKHFKCKFCEQTFCQSNKRKAHERVHTGERPYLCTICGKGFRINNGLRNHMYTHTGANPNTCSICTRQFPSKPQLRRHMEIHNEKTSAPVELIEPSLHNNNDNIYNNYDQASVIVESIESSFNRNNTIIAKHTRNPNTGLKIYPCKDCGKSFRLVTSLNEHLQSHTTTASMEKPFKCVVCNRDFTTHRYLALHMRIHTNDEKLYKCNYCSKQYLVEHNLTFHMKRKHNIVQSVVEDYNIVETTIATNIIENEFDDKIYVDVD